MNQRVNTLLHIKSIYPVLKPAERRVADEVLRRPNHVVHLSITELAKEAKVSDATVVKFCKRLGYKGFQEFKILLAQDVVVKRSVIEGEVEPGDDICTIKEKVFRSNISALQDTIQVLDADALGLAVKALAQAREIHFYGLGASSIAAFDGEQKFSRIGRRASAFVDTHMQITRAVLLQPGDVVIGLSRSGETREIVEAVRTAGECGAVTIAITNHSASSLAKEADLVLLTCTQGNLFSKGGISSIIAQLTTIDTLFMAVALVDLHRSQEVLDKTTEILSQRTGVL
ncbi:MAG TPA: RpiR family transcriptional regulator [Firmicutes bacterium]|nr:RpiR family transcriptional regulator [Bacillota bacterium]